MPVTLPPNPWDGPRTNHLRALWERFLATGNFPQLDRWLARTLKEYHQFGKRDRLVYADALFAIARHSGAALILERGFLDNASAPALLPLWRAAWPASEEGWHARLSAFPVDDLFAWMVILQGESPASRHDGASPRAQWFRRLEEAGSGLDLLLAGLPPVLEESLAARARLSGWSGEERQRFLSRQHQRPPLWLRLNRSCDRDAVLAELEARGLAPEICGLAIAVRGSASVHALTSYRTGAVEIQDRASQAIIDTLDPQPGEHVWDACTGGGGKAVAIGARLGNRGQVHASDVREHTLREVRRRAEKAGLTNVRAFAADATAEQRWNAHLRRRGGFDRVLVDAPCSGSGTWRRNPDNRWHVNRESLERLVALQTRLVAATARAVRPGGVLTYATCSWLPEENEAVVNAFLEDASGWSLETMHLTGSPEADADTMFCARLRRSGA